MKRILLASLAGAIILFLWGFISWTQAGWHDSHMKPFKDNGAIIKLISSLADGDGLYYYPDPMGAEDNASNQQRILALHEKGPIVSILYREKGVPIMDPIIFIRGFLVQFISVLIICMILSFCINSLTEFKQRFAVVSSIGLFAGLTTYISSWNWMFYPTNYSIGIFLDLVVVWCIIGLVISAIIIPKHRYKVGNI